MKTPSLSLSQIVVRALNRRKRPESLPISDLGHVVCERCADAYETTRTILPDENPWMCPSCRCTTGTRRRVYLCDGMGRDDLPQSDVFVSGYVFPGTEILVTQFITVQATSDAACSL